ncbi:hypothetical protein EJ377_04345 [Chryseobacterium arthrosphaerae]|uniref:Uncharacterized protein n=1 Tax=Chryseobacterium arthrosphaerae TaxID=651561 RepID=A0A432E1Z7_9FLAO|nr:hypothetical protein EJ377_04345 [Chryseobacterium arthrosphaerae]
MFGGHSDVIAGALIAKDAELGEKLHFIQFASAVFRTSRFLSGTERDQNTGLRMQRHSDNGLAVANILNLILQ